MTCQQTFDNFILTKRLADLSGKTISNYEQFIAPFIDFLGTDRDFERVTQEDIVAYIRANYKDPSLCLNKLSDEFGISESYFSHMFKENMNINFSVYLEDLRLNEAARLIKEGNSNLTEVSFEVGYNNPTSFRRAFKKKFGVTPSAMAAQ